MFCVPPPRRSTFSNAPPGRAWASIQSGEDAEIDERRIDPIRLHAGETSVPVSL